jgi:hypothetical protein
LKGVGNFEAELRVRKVYYEVDKDPNSPGVRLGSIFDRNSRLDAEIYNAKIAEIANTCTESNETEAVKKNRVTKLRVFKATEYFLLKHDKNYPDLARTLNPQENQEVTENIIEHNKEMYNNNNRGRLDSYLPKIRHRFNMKRGTEDT